MKFNTYGFTVRTESGRLVSWIVEAVSRRSAFNQLQSGDSPDQLLILTGRLSDEQKRAWVNLSQEYGGFDDQMARAILAEPLVN